MSTDPTTNEKCPCMDPCPMVSVMKSLSGKWKMSILCTIWLNGPMRYGELLRAIEGVTDTMLASSLKALEADGLTKRTQYNEMPVRVEYSLTDECLELMPILEQMVEWKKRTGSHDVAPSL